MKLQQLKVKASYLIVASPICYSEQLTQITVVQKTKRAVLVRYKNGNDDWITLRDLAEWELYEEITLPNAKEST